MNATFTEYGLGAAKLFAPLTADQKTVLAHMDSRNLGAIWFHGRYRFPVEIRTYPELATKIRETLNS